MVERSQRTVARLDSENDPQGDLLAGAETPPVTKAKPKSRSGRKKASIRVVTPSETLSNRPLKKHVAAIHTDGHLSLLQRKLSNVLLLNAYDHLLTETEHEIDEKTLCVMLGYDSNDRKPLKSALKALAPVHAEWNILDDNEEEVEWGVSSLLSHAVLTRGRCRYGYSPALAQKLYNPAIYASINMAVQRRFRSGHALALYENCYRFKRTGSTGWLPLEKFRRLLGVNDSDYYRQFKHLNAKIIKPTVREINKVSDIELTPEFKRKGRSVAEIRFKVRPNAQVPLLALGDDDGLRETTVFKRLEAAGIGAKLGEAWIRQHGESYVAEKLDLLDAQARGGKIKSLSGYLSAAIKDDYQSGGTSKSESDPESRAEAARILAEENARRVAREAERDAENQRIREEKDNAITRADAARAWLDAKSEAEQAILLARFAETLDKPFLRADFKRGGLKSLAVAIRFADFADVQEG